MTTERLLVSVSGLRKDYQGLRPLRIEALTLHAGDVVSLAGIDATAAELLVGLLTGALLPDAGSVELFGRSTREITDADAWLAMLDGVGIVTDRAVLIGQFSVEQNIAMPFTLEIDPLGDEVRGRVLDLALEVGLRPDQCATRVAEAAPEVQARVRLARALALQPAMLIAEHPSATLPRQSVDAFARDLRRVAEQRKLAVLAITADPVFAGALGGQTLTLEPATGFLRARGTWARWFRPG